MPNSAHHEDNGIAACVLTLLLDRKMLTSHTGKAPPVPTRYATNRPQSWSWCHGYDKTVLVLPQFKPRFLGHQPVASSAACKDRITFSLAIVLS